MRNDTVERVTDWESEPFNDGYDGLRELADREFTGATTDGHAWLFMLNGRVLGVFDGSMESFEDADGTHYTAPDPALPLLFAMQETGGETRAEYYTEDTPISEVDRTLQSGNFTGYIELSENVLSGDYYVAYYGGRQLPAAFVGNSGDLLTDDEAFERADDEVGIYQVTTVDLEITDIPEPESASATATGGVAASEATEEPEPESDESDPVETEAPADSEPETQATAAESEPSDATDAVGAADSSSEPEPADPTPDSDEPSADEPSADAPSADEPSATATDSAAREPAEPTRTESADAATADSGASKRVEPREPASNGAEPASDAVGAGARAGGQWHGAKTIPALDPEESVDMADEVDGDVDAEPVADAAATTSTRASVDDEAVAELRAERDRLQERVEELEAETDRLEGDTDRLERERDEARTRVSELEAEIEALESTVDRLESELADAEEELAAVEEYIPQGDHEVAPESALEGTNLFVRYERQGGPTLEDAHDGNAAREEVNENLRLEHHTEFDDEGAIVDGQPFPEWLQGTMEYGFARWLVGSFVHDIRETRNQASLGKLFDAIPEVDRVEFRGEIELDAADDGDIPDSVAFDVVLRDRMGSPLLVADLNDSREPATESMLGTLLENATPVGKVRDDLASAFFVTTSYYEPGALETAEEAVGGGFLSRDKQKSFVKFSRKSGYHLCLIETRDGEFHVSVPEL